MDSDEIFDVLGNSIRRQIIAVLHDTDTIKRDRLVDILAAAEANDEDDTQIRRRVRLKLHHNHLPRLADAEVIEYDEETITASHRLETVAQLLPVLDGDQTIAQA